jgi:Chaperone for flagella basal body P-ring formation
MQLKPRKVLLGALIAAAALSATRAQTQTVPRVELLGRVSVSGKQVSLSDLLPRGTPETLRMAAAEVPLGRAPQPGRERSIDRADIERALAGHTGIFSSLSVPDRIAVSSAARPITAEEAYQAIRAELRKKNLPAAELLRRKDIQLGAQVFVRPGDAGLRVTRMDLDALLGRARFLLWPANDPEIVPFFATARLDPASSARLAHSDAARLSPGSAAERRSMLAETTRAAVREILVRPGQRTVLTLENAKMQITVDVVPLERGSLGQQIRVRMADSGKIVTAEVIGRARLEAQL